MPPRPLLPLVCALLVCLCLPSASSSRKRADGWGVRLPAPSVPAGIASQAKGGRCLIDPEIRRVLLYTSVGLYTVHHHQMLRMMVQSSLFHLGPRAEVALIAHHSWAKKDLGFVHHLLLLFGAPFFDLDHIPVGAGRPSMASQSSANKLRIFQLLPAIDRYDAVLMLDVDILLQANVLALVGRICPDVLYVTAEHTDPNLLPGKGHPFWQARNYTPAEVAFMRKKGLFVFNGGQFLFRPTPYMKDLFWESYRSYRANSGVSIYEQGHLNTVFLLHGQLQYALTHLVFLGVQLLSGLRAPVDSAILHFCGAGAPATEKLPVMQRHFPAAFRPHSLVRDGILKRILNSLSAVSPGSDDVIDIVAPYSQLVSDPNVTHMCEVGFPSGHTAAMALFANPSAGLTVFDTAGAASAPSTLGVLRSLFPDHDRLRYRAGPLADLLANHTALVAAGHSQRCGSVLLPVAPDEGFLAALQRLLPILGPPGLVFAPHLSPRAMDGWHAAQRQAILQPVQCSTPIPLLLRPGSRKRWCVGRALGLQAQ
eukprot:EG_transcript_8549